MTRRRAHHHGFTLIELLIVVIIVAILSAIALPIYLTQRNQAKDAAVKTDVDSLQIGLAAYTADNNDGLPASGSLSMLKGVYLDSWPQDPFSSGDMSYSASTSPGSYAYTSDGSSYVLTGWLSNGRFQVAGGSAASTSFGSVSSNLISLMLAYYAKHGSWPRSWSPYNYTDLGLDPTTYAAAIGGLSYKPGGSTMGVSPASGYTITVTGTSGQKFTLTYALHWNLVYDATTGKWYYHTETAANQIDVSTLVVSGG